MPPPEARRKRPAGGVWRSRRVSLGSPTRAPRGRRSAQSICARSIDIRRLDFKPHPVGIVPTCSSNAPFAKPKMLTGERP